MQKLEHYEAPRLTVVSFKVERGFLTGSLQGGAATMDFEGQTTSHGTTNGSGLGEYGYGNLFGRE